MKNSEKIILDLCGGTGAWSKPYKDAGYDVRVVTLPHCDILHTKITESMILFYRDETHIGRHWVDIKDVYGIFAAPPCTMFSRARTTAKEPRDFRGAMEIVQACLDVIWEVQYMNRFGLKFWAMENPAGHLRRFMGEPAFKFQPYDFGDRHSKETWLWGMFNDPKKKPIHLNQKELLPSRNNIRPLPLIPEDYIRDENMKSVQIRRSITPQGFAEAFYKVNK